MWDPRDLSRHPFGEFWRSARDFELDNLLYLAPLQTINTALSAAL